MKKETREGQSMEDSDFHSACEGEQIICRALGWHLDFDHQDLATIRQLQEYEIKELTSMLMVD